nr:hypothetical protein [Sphingomonas sp.]
MTKRERMQHDAEELARRTLGRTADEEVIRAVADKIYRSLPKQVREAA